MKPSEKDREAARCEICGEPMPPGEQMFKYHGFSGPCPSGKVAEIPADTTHELVCRLEGILHVQGANQDWMHATRLVREAIATARSKGYRAGLERGAMVARNVAGQFGPGSGQHAACMDIFNRIQANIDRALAGEDA